MRQFIFYLASGVSAAVVDFGMYYLLLYLGAWYVTANLVGGVLGFFAAFLLNKYAVFHKNNDFMKHLGRYFVVDLFNVLLLTLIMYVLVDFWSVDPRISKVISYIPVILWNFFVYKFFVYV